MHREHRLSRKSTDPINATGKTQWHPQKIPPAKTGGIHKKIPPAKTGGILLH
jgi:hypothetical protein